MDEPRVAALIGDWLLEASVLVAVFPAIDQLLASTPIRWRALTGAETFAGVAFAVGLYFKRRR